MENVHSLRDGEFTVRIDVAVVDAWALWKAAMLAWPEGDGSEAEELLGPPGQPDAEACLHYIATPASLPGCIIRQSSVERRPPGGAPPPKR